MNNFQFPSWAKTGLKHGISTQKWCCCWILRRLRESRFSIAKLHLANTTLCHFDVYVFEILRPAHFQIRVLASLNQPNNSDLNSVRDMFQCHWIVWAGEGKRRKRYTHHTYTPRSMKLSKLLEITLMLVQPCAPRSKSKQILKAVDMKLSLDHWWRIFYGPKQEEFWSKQSRLAWRQVNVQSCRDCNNNVACVAPSPAAIHQLNWVA